MLLTKVTGGSVVVELTVQGAGKLEYEVMEAAGELLLLPGYVTVVLLIEVTGATVVVLYEVHDPGEFVDDAPGVLEGLAP